MTYQKMRVALDDARTYVNLFGHYIEPEVARDRANTWNDHTWTNRWPSPWMTMLEIRATAWAWAEVGIGEVIF